MYTAKTLKRFRKPKFAGEIKNADSIGKVGNLRCGDVMEIFIKVRKNKKGKEVIEDISFLTYGCVAAIASTDIICELAKGKTLEKALKITSKDVIKKLGKVPEIKHHCSVLGLNALKEAINKYRKK